MKDESKGKPAKYSEKHSKLLKSDEKSAFAMLLPGFIMMSIFIVVPLLMAVYRSFFEYNSYSTNQKFIGFENFRLMIGNPTFMKSLWNVLWLTLTVTALMILISFLFALMLNALGNRLSRIARTVIYIPFLISGIVASIVFLFMTNYSGLINSIRIQMDQTQIAFAVEGLWPYISIIFPTLWLGFGYNTLVFYAGLINIPKTYYEAAKIDGAGSMKMLFSITLPNMKNYFVLLIIGLISSNLQMFDVPFMMTGGGPLDKTLTPVLYLFNLYRDPNQNSSTTIAGALLVMIPIVLINLIVFKTMRSEKSMDD